MRPDDEIACAIPWCGKLIVPDDPPVNSETGLCPDHVACVKCHGTGITVETKHENPAGSFPGHSYPAVKCTSCDHAVSLFQFSDMMLTYWSTIQGVLHRADFQWYTGSVVHQGEQCAFLPFEVTYSSVWARDVPTSAAVYLDQVFGEVPLDWIAQDMDFIYVPYKAGRRGRVEAKKYLRDVRRYVPTFIAAPVIEVHVDTDSEGYKEMRRCIDSLGMDGKPKKS